MTVNGGPGDDNIHLSVEGVAGLADGGTGDDLLSGGDYFDLPQTLMGGEGNDTLIVTADVAQGGAGDDLLVWRTDSLEAAPGSTLSGGLGADTFSLHGGGYEIATTGATTITDFDARSGDVMHVPTHVAHLDNGVVSHAVFSGHALEATEGGSILHLHYSHLTGGPDITRNIVLTGVHSLANEDVVAIEDQAITGVRIANVVSGGAAGTLDGPVLIRAADSSDILTVAPVDSYEASGMMGAGDDSLHLVTAPLSPGAGGHLALVDMGSGNDSVTLESQNDAYARAVIAGGDGDDRITSAIGGSYHGGAGADRIDSSAAPAFPQLGNDAGADTALDGGTGADSLSLAAGHHATLGIDGEADQASVAVSTDALDRDLIGTIDQIGAEDAIVLALPPGATGAVSYTFDEDRVTVRYEGEPVAKLGFQPGQAPVDEVGLTGILTVTR